MRRRKKKKQIFQLFACLQKKIKKKRRSTRRSRALRTKVLSISRTFFIIFVAMIITSGIAISILVYTQQHVMTPDGRPARVDAYFEKHNAPLAGYGDVFVRVADACDMDWRLLPAIAMRESTGGKRMQYNNPFGWGGARIPFDSIEHAIEIVGKNLCGENPNTSVWYSTTSTERKLYYYNGTVIPSYPREVMWIMDQF